MTRADELRTARQRFQRALALGVTPSDIERVEARDRWSASDRRLAAKRAAIADCGRELTWWQK